MTRNFVLLLSVPLGVVTSTVPVVAPVGTVVVISDFETMTTRLYFQPVLSSIHGASHE